MAFAPLGLAPFLCSACDALGMREPTAVQRACIPAVLRGQHVIGAAETGSGKTAAFALPLLQRLADDPAGLFALVLTPTRELAFQIAEQVRALGAGVGARCTVVVGGTDATRQFSELAHHRPHFVVATPGRLASILERERERREAPPDGRGSASATVAALREFLNGSGGGRDSNAAANADEHIDFSRLRFLVLDEADRLLDDAFYPALGEILRVLPGERRTLLFSATMSRNIAKADAMLTGPQSSDGSGDTDGGELGGRQSDNTSRGGHPTATNGSANARGVFRFDANALGLAEGRFATVAQLRHRYLFVPARVRIVYLAYVLLHACGSETAIERMLQRKKRSTMVHDVQRSALEDGAEGDEQDDRADAAGRPVDARDSDSDDDNENGGGERTMCNGDGNGGGEHDIKRRGGHRVAARSVIVFVATCNHCELVARMLAKLDLSVASLHARLNQHQRLESLRRFRASQASILVATDVAARGLDIPRVDLVVNYDLPREVSLYVHRVGRTARAGRRGTALSLVTQYDVALVHSIESRCGVYIQQYTENGAADEKRVMRVLAHVLKARRIAKMELVDGGFLSPEQSDALDDSRVTPRAPQRPSKSAGAGTSADTDTARSSRAPPDAIVRERVAGRVGAQRGDTVATAGPTPAESTSRQAGANAMAPRHAQSGGSSTRSAAKKRRAESAARTRATTTTTTATTTTTMTPRDRDAVSARHDGGGNAGRRARRTAPGSPS